MDWLDEIFNGDFGFGSSDPNAHFGENNAHHGTAQGPYGIPTSFLGSLYGGDPAHSMKASGNVGGMQPAGSPASSLVSSPFGGVDLSKYGFPKQQPQHAMPPISGGGGIDLGMFAPPKNQPTLGSLVIGTGLRAQ